MSEQNKAQERRLIEEVWNQRRYASINELIASDYIGHASRPEHETHGRDGYKRSVAGLHEAFPDIHFKIEDQIAEGDRVVTRWTARGTHKGVFRGLLPTGKQVNLTGITLDRIAGGKVVECWTNLDEHGLLQQLGAIPTREPVG